MKKDIPMVSQLKRDLVATRDLLLERLTPTVTLQTDSLPPEVGWCLRQLRAVKDAIEEFDALPSESRAALEKALRACDTVESLRAKLASRPRRPESDKKYASSKATRTKMHRLFPKLEQELGRALVVAKAKGESGEMSRDVALVIERLRDKGAKVSPTSVRGAMIHYLQSKTKGVRHQDVEGHVTPAGTHPLPGDRVEPKPAATG